MLFAKSKRLVEIHQFWWSLRGAVTEALASLAISAERKKEQESLKLTFQIWK